MGNIFLIMDMSVNLFQFIPIYSNLYGYVS